jgi:hypothetical protein
VGWGGQTAETEAEAAALCLASWQNFRPLIHVTREDFDAITHDRALCDSEGAIDAAGFEAMMREQVSPSRRKRRVIRVPAPPCSSWCARCRADSAVRRLAIDCCAGRQLRNYALSRLSKSYSRSAAESAAAEFCALKMLMIQQLKTESQHAILRADIRQARSSPAPPAPAHPPPLSRPLKLSTHFCRSLSIRSEAFLLGS